MNNTQEEVMTKIITWLIHKDHPGVKAPMRNLSAIKAHKDGGWTEAATVTPPKKVVRKRAPRKAKR